MMEDMDRAFDDDFSAEEDFGDDCAETLNSNPHEQLP